MADNKKPWEKDYSKPVINKKPWEKEYASSDVKKKVASKSRSQEELWGSDSQPQDLYTSLVTGAQEPQQVSDGLGGQPKKSSADNRISQSLSKVNQNLMNDTEENVVAQLSKDQTFKDLGFSFEESGWSGDYVTVTAPNKKTKEISLDNFLNSKSAKQSVELQNFIKQNTTKEKRAEFEQISQIEDSNIQKLQSEKKKFGQEFDQGIAKGFDKKNSKYLNDKLQTVNSKLINQNEEYVVPQMNYQFGDLGFKFEESGATGDWMIATAPNGKKMEISLDPFMSAKAASESAKLQQFIRENTPSKGLYVIEKTESEANQKINSQKDVDASIKRISDEANSLNSDLKAFLSRKNALDTTFEKGSEGYNQMQEELIAERDELIKKQNNLKTKEVLLKKSVGKYTSMRSEQGTWLAGTWNALMDASASGTAGFVDMMVDIGAEITPNEMMMSPKDLKNSSLGISKKLGIKAPSASQTYAQWKESLTEDQKDSVEDEMDDVIKKSMKKDAIPLIRQGNRQVFGSSTATPEWDQLKSESFWGGAYLGLVKTAPALIGGSGPAGWAQRTAQMYALVSDGVRQEMDKNPEFDNVSENQKLAVVLPVGITGAILEEFGLKNIKGSTGLINKIAMSALGKAGTRTTAKTFRELVENEVESGLARGLLTIGSAGLAEVESGAAQTAAELTIKEIYNQVTNKKMFETPETIGEWVNDITIAGAQEAVGGFVLGMPTAISAAYSEKGFLKMSDDNFRIFEAAANDDNIQKAFITNLKTQVTQGIITTAEAKEQLNNYRNSVGLFKSLPDGLNTQQKKEAMNLLKEKRDLQNQVDGKDPSLVKKLTDRIAAIDASLIGISEATVTEEPAVEESIDAEKNKEYLGTPTISTIEDGDLYEFKTQDGIIGGVMISPTEFRIDGISANEVGKGQGSKMFEALIENLKTKGVTTLTTKSAGEGAVKMHNKAVDKGLLTKVKEDGRTATFSINSEIEIPAAVEEVVPTVEEVKPVEVDNRPISERQAEAESKIKRKDLFTGVGDFSTELGGSDASAVPVSHKEVNGIELVEYAHPKTGSVDVIVTGKSDNDFVGFYRIYENGEPTNKWSSKFENQSRNKEDFKTMISGVQSLLPEGHEYTEKTSISTDGLRVWGQQLERGYELQTDENGNIVTNEVAINGDAIVNELGIDVNQGNFDNISVTNNEQFQSVKKSLLPYLQKFGLNESNIRNVNGTVEIDLPVLKKSTKKAAAVEVTAPKTQAEQYSEELDKTKESDPEAYWSVSPVSAADAAKGTIIDTPDGAAIVKPDGDIAGLFKKATSKAKGVAQDLLKRAVAAGGKKLDNFDTYLTPQYIKAGFRVVSRVPFSLEYGVPAGYNKEKHGTPDVVAMIYDPEGKLDIEEKTFDDYDEAMAYRDSFLEPSIDAELEGLAKLFDESDKGFRMSQVDRAKEALKKILPGVEFIVHETDEAFNKATGDSRSGGMYIYRPAREGAPASRVIHINKKYANGRTVAHEVFHAVILDKIKGDKKVQEITARMVDAVYKTASPELRAELDAFAARYSDKTIRDEERLAELLGIIADGYPKMSQINKGIVKRWLEALAKMFGRKPFTDNEVIDLLNTLARKVSTGEVISEEDVAILSEKEINIPGSQIIGSINIKFRRQAKVADFDTTPPKVEGVNMIYPSKSDIKDVLEKSGGAAVFINSDGTKVGKVSINGRDIIVQGGIDYTFIKENVDDNIGFAASEDSKISYLKSISDELIKERDAKNPQHKGKPIAVFVVAQNGETMLGEWYAAEYIMEGIDQSISKNEVVLEDIKKDFIDAIESAKLSGNKSGLADRKAKDKVLKMIKEGKFDTQKGRIEIAKEMASKEFSFGFRVNLNKELIAGNEKSWNSGKNRGIKKALSDVGHTMNDFWNKFLDERFLNKLNNTKLQADKGSSISNKTFSGFFYNPSDSLEDQVSHAKLGIDHAQFNSSFKSQENFLLDSAYDVNKLFPNMGYPTQSGIDLYNSKNKTDLNKKNMSIIDKIKVSTWLNKNNSSKLVVNPYSSISLSIYTGTVNEEPQIEEGKTIKKLQQAKSIDEIVRIAKEAKYSDAAITAFLKANGFSDAQIANALSTDRPSVNKIYEDSKKAIEDKKKRTSIKDLAPFLRKSILDRQTYIKKVINRIDNKSAKKAYDLLVTKAGASALAAERFKRAEKKIYGGLNADDTSTLDKIIYAKRMVSVNESRAKLGLESYKGMDGYSIDDANKDLADFKNSLGDKKFNDLSNRATEYFDVFKLNLKKLYESGRISKETYESLKDTEYSPIKTIKYIIGDNLSVDEIDTQAKSLGISRNDIMKLSDSNENEIIMDSKWLLAMSINSVEGRAFENNMLREFDKAIKNATPEEKKAFEDIILDNPVVGTKKDGGLKYKYDDTRLPVGFAKVSYFNDGNKVEMILKDQYAKQLLDVKNKNKALETLGKLTGTKILRFFATGGNPLFIIGNTAVDFQNIAFFSNVYSKFKPMATAQLASDYTKNFVKKLVMSNEYNTIFNEYINHGGALDYMASDGLRSLESMNPVKGVTKAVQKGLVAYGRAMSLLGETSEVAFRLSVFQKVKDDSIKEFKKENNREPNAQELDDIMWNAGRQSRETMDFSQGGDVAKNIDAVFPYFNAALQGIRRPIDFATKDPVGFSSSVLQYTAMASSLAAGSFAMLISAVGGDDDEEKAKNIMNAMNSLSEYEKANYHIMFTGEKNKDGEYEYYRAKKLPVLSVISTVAEQLIYKAFFNSKGIEYDMDSEAMLEAVSKSNPLPVTVQEVAGKNPVASGLVSYWANKDTFTGDKIFREPDNKKILPEAEGMFDDRVDQIYKDLSPGFGLSPARTKVMVEKVITSANTNPTIPLIYSAYDGLFSKNNGLGAEAKEAMSNVGDAFGKKVVRYTDKKIIRYKNQDDKEYQESLLETKVWSSEQKVYNEIKKRYDGGGSVTKKELIDLVKENFEPMDYMKYAKKYNAYIHNMNIDKSVLDIIFEDVPEVQAMKLNQRYGPNLESEELNELGMAMNSAGKRINNKSIYIYNKKYKNRKNAQ